MAFSCILMALSVLLTPACAAAHNPPPSNATDLAALLAFKAHVKDPLGVLSGNWTAAASFCWWVGVSCDHRGRRVSGLVFTDVPLQGSIAPQLGNLSFLSSLVLSNNSLVGSVPDELGGLHRLLILDLSENSLKGTIPPTLGNLIRLETLDLDSNNLFGEIPHELQNLRSLQTLNLAVNDLSGALISGLFNNTPYLSVIHLGSNRLTGGIPASIASLSKLKKLVLQRNLLSGPMTPAIFNMSQLQAIGVANNNLSGTIPGNESFHLPMLQVFSIGLNQFEGPIPLGLSACKNLETLSLSVSNFTGTVPPWLATLPNLTEIYLSTNDITGKIPIELCNHTKLVGLDLSENKLQGRIPAELGQLTNLVFLSFASNQITGDIPESIGNLSILTIMDLFGNGLSGSVPVSFGNLLNLREIYLNMNQFSGTLVHFLAALSKCRRLITINIARNTFTGSLPPYMGNLSTVLQYFIADQNRITGSIPTTVANLSNLLVLSLGGNNLSDKIPTPVIAMDSLQQLDLSYNSLSGTIPEEINRSTSLVNLYLQGNKLAGSIPSGFGRLIQLQYVALSQNSFSSEIPSSLWNLQKLIELDLSQNSLSGSLPPDVRKLTTISKMDLSDNQLSGNLPVSLGELNMMIYLNLSRNLFQGSIPDSLGRLINIEKLDLSNNVLSGVIPKALANLSYLANLNLSFNRLDGQIPEGGVFSNITLESLMGNNALCGHPTLGIAPCQNKTNNHSRSKQQLLKVLLPSMLAFFVSVSCLCMLVRIKINWKGNTALASGTDLLSYQLISYHELVRATNNFSDDNLLGAGSFGKVFKGQLDDESVIAVKVLNMQDESASKSFDTECRALRMVRHRNLVSIISTCSNLDFKALILQYMPNGSLNDWLYSDDERQLSFLQRVGIMLDVATAMEYLHNQILEAVLHCDLKPSNILLDEEMTAHVSDFGISKLLVGDDCSIVLTSMPGTIGYMAPEFGSTGKASRASDIYSYGIILLEAFTGKRPTDPMFMGELSLRQWVSQAFLCELSHVVDSRLLQYKQESYIEDTSRPPVDSILNACLASIIDLALLCSRAAPDERIPMTDVAVKLNNIKSYYNTREDPNFCLEPNLQ